MVIYIDLVFLINFILDLLLLLTVNVALKRYSRFFKLVLGAVLGSISLVSLFLHLNSITLSLLKVLMGILMCLVAFGYKNIRYTFYNVIYLYMTSISLG
ncbi:MAG: sigma-E processing peptidase SpoIIGA [Bacilli bacterium]|nr:sigma-E processing peptidase SpoIIGA [Bacilli bacterium]